MGVARIFQRGGHTLSNRGYSRFRNLNIAGCLSKKRLTKGGSRAPQDPPPPPLATPLIIAFKTSEKFVPKYFQWPQSSTRESLISLVPEIQTRFWTSYEMFQMAYLHLDKLNQVHRRPWHLKNKREQMFSYTYGGLVSTTSRELRAITMAFSLPAFQQPIRSRLWSAKIWPTVRNS